MKELAKKFPKMWMKEGEDFSPSYEGAIWTGEGSEHDDLEIFNYWSMDYEEKVYVMGVLKEVRKVVEDAGWWIECHDAGTYFIFPDA